MNRIYKNNIYFIYKHKKVNMLLSTISNKTDYN